MSPPTHQPDFLTRELSRKLAEQYLVELTQMANQIPEVEYGPDDVLAEQKGPRQLFNKWSHSLITLDGDNPVGFVMGYERQGEDNDQYPRDTVYISELAVSREYQGRGIGRTLLEQFFERNNELGFLTLSDELNYSVQTNSADWNQHVVDLYKSFGFEQRAAKEYPSRTDAVLGVSVIDLTLVQIPQTP